MFERLIIIEIDSDIYIEASITNKEQPQVECMLKRLIIIEIDSDIYQGIDFKRSITSNFVLVEIRNKHK